MQLHIDLHSLDIVKWQIAPYRAFDCSTRFSLFLRILSKLECAKGPKTIWPNDHFMPGSESISTMFSQSVK